MIQKLQPQQYSQAAALFTQREHHLFCHGVLAGNYPGQVFVDDAEVPTSALLTKNNTWCYLGGNPHNELFNEALRDALRARTEIGKDTGALLISPNDPGWVPVIATLVEGRNPLPTGRHLYVADTQHFLSHNALPDGFSLHFIDETVADKVTQELPGDVQDVLRLRAASAEPNTVAFGFIAIHETVCVAQAFVDCIVGNRGEIGLFTSNEFRQCGLATAVSSATIHYALTHGLTAVHWDCAASNAGSIRLAQKMGLCHVLDHTHYLIVFDETGHLLNVAWTHLDANQFAQTLDVCQPLMDVEKPSMYTYYLAGAASAGLGEQESAVGYLHTAVSLGWDDLAEMTNCVPLQVLHQLPEWAKIIAGIEENMKPEGIKCV